MSEMIKRVEKALQKTWDKQPGYGPPDFDALARAAIGAMRDPTEDMCEAGAVYYDDNWQKGKAKEQTSMPFIWEAMVDAALDDKKEAGP